MPALLRQPVKRCNRLAYLCGDCREFCSKKIYNQAGGERPSRGTQTGVTARARREVFAPAWLGGLLDAVASEALPMNSSPVDERQAHVTSKSTPLWQTVFIWTAANALGIAASMPLSALISLVKPLAGLAGSAVVIGIPVGVMQWLALRRTVRVSPLWILTVFLGLVAVGWLAGLIAFHNDEGILELSSLYALGGLIIGLLQWSLLFRHFRRSFWYPLSSALGLGLALWVVLVTNLVNANGSFALALGILIYSVATGVTLARLPAASPPEPAPAPDQPA